MIQRLKSNIFIARKAKKLFIGYDMMKELKVKAELVVLACDASERTKTHAAKFAEHGDVLQTDFTMAQLGDIVGAQKVATFAVTEKGLAAMIKKSFEDISGKH